MPRGKRIEKEALFHILFQGRSIPIKGLSDLETVTAFLSLIREGENAMRRGIRKQEPLFHISLVEEKKTVAGKRRGKGQALSSEKRKKRVAKLVAKGIPKTQIAKKLGVTPMTVARDLKETKKEEK